MVDNAGDAKIPENWTANIFFFQLYVQPKGHSKDNYYQSYLSITLMYYC